MVKYEIAEAITGRNEGGYAHNPADRGGETYAGIARNFWPKWEGWTKVDKAKSEYASSSKVSLAKWINFSAKAHGIEREVSSFYKQNFWDTLSLDAFTDQQLANTVYDFGVNSGTGRSAKFLQQVAGVSQDGKIGPATLVAVNSANPQALHAKFNKAREDFYRSIAKGNQAQFLRSWLSRLTPYNEMKMIQYKLGLTADGVYGPATKEAIKTFQSLHGLTPDGIPGEKTMAKFYSA